MASVKRYWINTPYNIYQRKTVAGFLVSAVASNIHGMLKLQDNNGWIYNHTINVRNLEGTTRQKKKKDFVARALNLPRFNTAGRTNQNKQPTTRQTADWLSKCEQVTTTPQTCSIAFCFVVPNSRTFEMQNYGGSLWGVRKIIPDVFTSFRGGLFDWQERLPPSETSEHESVAAAAQSLSSASSPRQKVTKIKAKFLHLGKQLSQSRYQLDLFVCYQPLSYWNCRKIQVWRGNLRVCNYQVEAYSSTAAPTDSLPRSLTRPRKATSRVVEHKR